MTYESVTPDQVSTLVSELEKSGQRVTMPVPNSYVIEGHGIKVQAVYTPASNALAVSVLSKPFFISESFINAGILKALGRA